VNDTIDQGGWAADAQDPVARAYEMHAPELRRFATARTRDAVAAEDIVQESFLRLSVEARAERFPRQPRGWLYRVAMNLIISGARRTKTSPLTTVAELPERSDLDTPESRFLAGERSRMLRTAMESTGRVGRTGLVMAAAGYSGREIAAVLGRSEVATRALMCRARTSVRRTLTLAEAV
jgi:RNA polymerase sigma factor (sigma-70 family)